MLLISGKVWAQNESIAPHLQGDVLINLLKKDYKPTNTKRYDVARLYVYTQLDVDEADSLTDVYTGLRVKKDGTGSPKVTTVNGHTLSFNTEHTWPQSFYANTEPMRGDVHHLFPVWSVANSIRNNHPFAEIPTELVESWWHWSNGTKIEYTPTSSIEEYSRYYNKTFEPRKVHKGNAARAMFYFWTMYQDHPEIKLNQRDNCSFFDGMKDDLYLWHLQDPVDSLEIARSFKIEAYQGNINPFVHDTSLVRRAYFTEELSYSCNDDGSGVTSSYNPLDIYISEVFTPYGNYAKYLEFFNDTDKDISFNDGNWELRKYENANVNPVNIKLSGTIKSKDFFVIGDEFGNEGNNNGVRGLFGEGIVNQHSGAITHNGNEKYELVHVVSGRAIVIDEFGMDNKGNDSNFSNRQVAYRIYSALPNDGNFDQKYVSNNGDTVSSGNWVVFNVEEGNTNAKLVATPGYSSGIESPIKSSAMITGSAGWRLLSIPANNATLSMIVDNTAIQGVGDGFSPNVYTHNSSGLNETPSSLEQQLENGVGLWVYFFDNTINGSRNLPLRLTVEANEPTEAVVLNLNTNVAIDSSYFTLAGNPYQSKYNASSLIVDNTIQEYIQILENEMYRPVLMSSAVLLPWQGFWVESSAKKLSNTLTFPLEGKVNAVAPLVEYSKISTEEIAIQLNLKSDQSLDIGCKIAIHPSATLGWDRFDATKLMPSKAAYGALACVGEDKLQSVYSLPSKLDGKIEIPLSITSVNVANELELLWELPYNIPKNWNITVIDTKLNQSMDLKTEASYRFEQTSKKRKITLKEMISEIPLSENNTQTSQVRFVLQIELNSPTGTESEIASKWKLNQNYPNPFNPTTTITYSIPTLSNVRLSVYSIAGQEVARLVDGEQLEGVRQVIWNADSMASGVYYARLQAGAFTKTIKMALIK